MTSVDFGVRRKAIAILIFTTACWGLSFPVFKALMARQTALDSELSSWFLSTLSLTIRFTIAAFVLWRPFVRLSRAEWSQGLGLGVFAAGGLVFQMDALHYTQASTAAFLTQAYCVWIPIYAAILTRRWPSKRVFAAVACVVAGVAMLSRVGDGGAFRFGRGELETIVASLMFTGQILWVERPAYRMNRTGPVTCLMFAIVALLMGVATGLQAPVSAVARVSLIYGNAFAWGCTALLLVFCTLFGYVLMNRWQREVSATEAGLIYCVEPLFASLFAIAVGAESLTLNLVWGGGLILLANVVLQLPWGAPPDRVG